MRFKIYPESAVASSQGIGHVLSTFDSIRACSKQRSSDLSCRGILSQEYGSFSQREPLASLPSSRCSTKAFLTVVRIFVKNSLMKWGLLASAMIFRCATKPVDIYVIIEVD